MSTFADPPRGLRPDTDSPCGLSVPAEGHRPLADGGPALGPLHAAALGSFASRIHAWCDANDPYCASGVNLTVHLTYLNRYQGAAASFVLSKIGG